MCSVKIIVKPCRRSMHVTDAMVVCMLIVSGMKKIRKVLELVILAINAVYVFISTFQTTKGNKLWQI